MPIGTLPKEAKDLYEKVYQSYLDKGLSKEEAAKRAWGAVKNAGYAKGSDGKWHKASELAEFSLSIKSVGVNKTSGERYWKANTSDVLPDSYNDEMTLDLYKSFIRRATSGEKPPERFCSESWGGGMPYVSVAHFREHSIAGDTDKIYVDGDVLKANGTFRDTSLGRACFDAVFNDLYSPQKSDAQDKIRVSIGFLDFAHKHKSNGYMYERNDDRPFCPECLAEVIEGKSEGKIFLDGLLVHFAMTRVPVNKRTSMEVRSMATTRKQDAASIVGEALAEELEEKEHEMTGKSEALVIKSEDEIVEKCEDMPMMASPMEYHPFGGATTLADAKAYVTAGKEQQRIGDIWNAFRMVIENITEDDNITDKAAAVVKASNELKDMIASNDMIFESETIEDPELVEEATTKTVGGQSYPSSDFLVVEDASSPSTWHLQVKKHGKPDHGLMGAAKAALTSPGGHRGNKYQGPNKSSAISKLKALYKAEKMAWKADIEDDPEEELEIPATETEEIMSDKVTPILEHITALETAVQGIMNRLDALAPKSDVVIQPHPLDGVIAQLKSDFTAVSLMNGTTDERLQAIQGTFNALGDELRKSLAVEQKSDAPAGMSEVLATIHRLTEKVDLLASQQRSIAPASTSIPSPRSINPALVQQVTKPAPAPTGPTPHLRSLIDRSVGVD